MACKAVRNKCQLCQKKLWVALTHRTHNMFRGIPIYSYSHCCLEYHRFYSHLYYTPTFRVNDKDRSRHRTRRAFAAASVPVYRLYHWKLLRKTTCISKKGSTIWKKQVLEYLNLGTVCSILQSDLSHCIVARHETAYPEFALSCFYRSLRWIAKPCVFS